MNLDFLNDLSHDDLEVLRTNVAAKLLERSDGLNVKVAKHPNCKKMQELHKKISNVVVDIPSTALVEVALYGYRGGKVEWDVKDNSFSYPKKTDPMLVKTIKEMKGAIKEIEKLAAKIAKDLKIEVDDVYDSTNVYLDPY